MQNEKSSTVMWGFAIAFWVLALGLFSAALAGYIQWETRTPMVIYEVEETSTEEVATKESEEDGVQDP